MIGEVGASQVNQAATAYKKVDPSDPQGSREVAVAHSTSAAVKDTVTLNTPQDKAVTYSSPLSDKELLDNKFLMLRALVANIFKSQGLVAPVDSSATAPASSATAPASSAAAPASSAAAGGDGTTAATTDGAPQGSSVIDVGGGSSADIATMTPEDAKKLVAEDGYWGVKQTSERIFKQAVAISGNDPTRIDKVKEGILTGFGMARTALGSALPDISAKTLDAVMKKLDDWTKNSAQPVDQSQQSTASP